MAAAGSGACGGGRLKAVIAGGGRALTPPPDDRAADEVREGVQMSRVGPVGARLRYLMESPAAPRSPSTVGHPDIVASSAVMRLSTK
jgi:hypothetical protein